ncbi:unnamed protein product [Callosobruchus maculatus]|uniref:Uncharacterized protein n=1 Tax=Callosobruchus maculatus TaxID=64391 RepID=A0A653C6Z3_CALMS|nr:unnamed protein product [Callosobruchus maculatus]
MDEAVKEPSRETISCPSISGDEDLQYDMDYYIDIPEEEGEASDIKIDDYLAGTRMTVDVRPEEPQADDSEKELTGDAGEEAEEEEEPRKENGEGKEGEEGEPDEEAKKDDETKKEEELPGEGGFEEGAELIPQDLEYVAPEEETALGYEESVETLFEEPRKIEPEPPLFDDQKALLEDLERLKALQEIPGETDEELEKYKCALIEDMPLTGSQLQAVEHFGPAVGAMEPIGEGAILGEEVGDEEEEFVGESEGEDKGPQYEEVWVDAIPGIGPIVPEHLVRAVGEYMSSVATIQHGMVMPRNVRHYNCPPLEVVEY